MSKGRKVIQQFLAMLNMISHFVAVGTSSLITVDLFQILRSGLYEEVQHSMCKKYPELTSTYMRYNNLAA